MCRDIVRHLPVPVPVSVSVPGRSHRAPRLTALFSRRASGECHRWRCLAPARRPHRRDSCQNRHQWHVHKRDRIGSLDALGQCTPGVCAFLRARPRGAG